MHTHPRTKWLIGVVTLLLVLMAMGLTRPLPSALAGGAVWQPATPNGGTMFDISSSASNPQRLYVRSLAGISRSTDGGDTWELVAPYYAGEGYNAVLIDPANENSAMMVLENGNLYRTADGGDTWNERALPFDAASIAFSADGSHVWATGDDNVYQSVDGGTTWTERPFPANTLSRYVTAHPTIANKIYVTTNTGALLVSSDGGTTWESRAAIGAYRLEAVVGTTLYGIWTQSTGDNGVYKSTDDGASWSASNTGLPGRITSLVADPNDASRLYAAAHNGDIYRTTANGTAWEATNAMLPDGFSVNGGQLALIPTSAPTIFYADDGIYKSSDNGSSWQFSGESVSAIYLEGFAVAPDNAARLLGAGWRIQLFESETAGEAWTTTPLTASMDINTIVFAPSDPTRIYVGTEADGLYRSSDNGATWTPISAGLPDDFSYVNDIAVAPNDPNRVVAALDIGLIYRSTNGGDSWTMVYDHNDTVEDVAFAPTNPSLVWVAGHNELLHSSDGGAIWAIPATTGLPPSGDVRHVAVDPTTASTLYLGITSTSVLYKSSDGGTTWQALTTGIPASATVSDIWIDPAAPQTLLVAANFYSNFGLVTQGFGIQRSTNGGATWQPYNEGLTQGAVAHIEGTADTLYAATVYGGVWRLGAAVPQLTPTAASTATPTATPTVTASPTATPIFTATPSAAPTLTATATATPTLTPAPSTTATPSATPPPVPPLYLPLVGVSIP